MESVLVWLAVMAATFHMAQTQCMDTNRNSYDSGAALTIAWARTSFYLTARTSICSGREWRTVCDNGWNVENARVLCRQNGYSGAQPCGDSCFGCNNRFKGVTIHCTGSEARLSDCRKFTITTPCTQCAGVVCIQESSQCLTPPVPDVLTSDASPPATCAPPEPTAASIPPATAAPIPPETTAVPANPATSAPPETTAPETASTGDNCTCPIGEGGATDHTRTPISPPSIGAVVVGGGAQQSCPSLAVLGGGLGALTAILAILLVGVVIGWVWTCRRKSVKSGHQERSHPETAYPNPTYSPISPLPAPSVQYSSIGPRGAQLTTATPHYETMDTVAPQEGVYHVLETPHGERRGRERDYERQEDTVYHTLGDVGGGVSVSPAPSQQATAQPGGEPMDTEYSKLQHLT